MSLYEMGIREERIVGAEEILLLGVSLLHFQALSIAI